MIEASPSSRPSFRACASRARICSSLTGGGPGETFNFAAFFNKAEITDYGTAFGGATNVNGGLAQFSGANISSNGLPGTVVFGILPPRGSALFLQ